MRRGGPYCEDGNILEPILGSPDLRKLPSPAGSAKLEDSEAYHNRVYTGVIYGLFKDAGKENGNYSSIAQEALM